MGTLRDKNKPAHEVDKGNSRIDGPYLDDINRARDDAYVNSRKGGKVSDEGYMDEPVENDFPRVVEKASDEGSTPEVVENEEPFFPVVEEKEGDDN